MSAPLEARAFVPADVDLPEGSMVAHGVTLTLQGRIVAVGGLVVVGQHWWTFAEIGEEARRPLVLHRLVMRALRAADDLGLAPIYGYCDERKPRALEWIKAMGFRLARDDERDGDVQLMERWCGRPAWIREQRSGY